jgi:hypothetical protein
MITAETLTAAGYQRYKDVHDVGALYQKVIWEDGKVYGKKAYFINFEESHYGRFVSKGFHVDVKFYREDGATFELTLNLTKEHTVEAVEAFYASAYIRLNCCPDALNN